MNETITVELRQEGTQLDADRQQFALALKTWRIRMHYTQEQAARLVGCSRWTIIRAEQAKDISWQAMYRIFAFLSVELQREKL